jgi:hypothetical protein
MLYSTEYEHTRLFYINYRLDMKIKTLCKFPGGIYFLVYINDLLYSNMMISFYKLTAFSLCLLYSLKVIVRNIIDIYREFVATTSKA